jgi:cytidyltransferase-like protein
MLAEDARKLLFRVADVLDEVGLRFFLAYGTALGAIREGRIIAHDDDLDIGCLAEDFQPLAPLIALELRQRNLFKQWIDHRHTRPWSGGVYAIKFGDHLGNTGDLAVWFPCVYKRFQPGHANDQSIVYPHEIFENLTGVDFYGRRFLIPAEKKRYLELTYGANWRTPLRRGKYSLPAIRQESATTPMVYVAMCADPLHRGHISVLRQAACYGEVVVGLLTDEAIAQYKPHPPACCFADRLAVLSALDGVRLVIPQTTLDYRPNLQRLKPDIVVHGDDWHEGPQQQARHEVIDTLATWDGQLVEVPYTPGISSTQIKERLCAGR